MLKRRAEALRQGMARRAAGIRPLAADIRGVSAVEFSLLLPVLVAMLAGALELSGAITAANRATYVAEAIGQVVSQAKGPIGAADLAAFIKSAALIDPDVVAYAAATGKNLDQAVNVDVSSILFTPKVPSCTQNCVYEANVVFSEALAGPKRACGTLSPGSGRSVATLPAGIFSSGPLVVVDVETFYRPMMTTFLGSEISFKRSAYFRPRYVKVVNSVSNCPGYPVT